MTKRTNIFPFLSGVIELSSGTYAFRTDHGYNEAVWAWNIYDDYNRATVHKWDKIPNNHIIHLFDFDNPPATVPYIPLLD